MLTNTVELCKPCGLINEFTNISSWTLTHSVTGFKSFRTHEVLHSDKFAWVIFGYIH